GRSGEISLALPWRNRNVACGLGGPYRYESGRVHGTERTDRRVEGAHRHLSDWRSVLLQHRQRRSRRTVCARGGGHARRGRGGGPRESAQVPQPDAEVSRLNSSTAAFRSDSGINGKVAVIRRNSSRSSL